MQLLIVEDNAPDAELTVRQLRAAGIDCTWTRVATEDAFRDALLSPPDLIISDCTLPDFDGVSAFSIAAAETPEIPVGFESGKHTGFPGWRRPQSRMPRSHRSPGGCNL